MPGGIVGLIIQLIAGAAGGNIVGALAKQRDLGPIWNSVAGIVGGGIGRSDSGSCAGRQCGCAGRSGHRLDLHGRRTKPLDTVQHRLVFEQAYAADLEWS
jgi:hypothetical protein